MDNNRVTTTTTTSTNHQHCKKKSKPVMEKRRRARINASLAELKSLLLDAIKMEGTRHSKMEKADILELAVRHLKDVQMNPFSAATNPTSSVLSKYVMGFQACATEVSKYLSHGGYEDFNLKSKLLHHLADCLAGGDDVTNSSKIPPSTLPTTSTSIFKVNDHCTNNNDANTDLAATHSTFVTNLSSLSSRLNTDQIVSGDIIDNTTAPKESQCTVSSSTQAQCLRLSNASSASISPQELHSSRLCLLSPNLKSSQMTVKEDFTHLSERDNKRSNKESIIVTSKDDEENDVSFNDNSDIDDNTDEDDGDADDTSSNNKSIKNHSEDKTLNEITNNMSINTIPQTSVQAITHNQGIADPNLASIQAEFNQLNSQTLSNQNAPKSQLPLIVNFQQQPSGLNAYPFPSNTIRFVSPQSSSNEVSLILLSNLNAACGSSQKLYVPLLQPQTVQEAPAALVTPQIVQSTPMPAIQIQTMQPATLPPLQQHVVSLGPHQPHVIQTPNRLCLQETNCDSTIFTSTDIRGNNILTNNSYESSSKKAEYFNNLQTCVSTAYPIQGVNSNNKDPKHNNLLFTPIAPENTGICANLVFATNLPPKDTLNEKTTCAITPKTIVGHQLQTAQITNQDKGDSTESINNQPKDNIYSPINYQVVPNSTSLQPVQIVQNNENERHSLMFSTSPPHFSNPLTNIPSNLDPSPPHVISTLPSENLENNKSLLQTDLIQNNLHGNPSDVDNMTLPIPILSSQPHNCIGYKRAHSPTPTKTYKRWSTFRPDYPQSNDEAYSVNGLDLSIPGAKRENDRALVGTNNSLVHGSPIKGPSPMIGGRDDTSPMKEIDSHGKDTPVATNNNPLCKDPFFRPW